MFPSYESLALLYSTSSTQTKIVAELDEWPQVPISDETDSPMRLRRQLANAQVVATQAAIIPPSTARSEWITTSFEDPTTGTMINSATWASDSDSREDSLNSLDRLIRGMPSERVSDQEAERMAEEVIRRVDDLRMETDSYRAENARFTNALEHIRSQCGMVCEEFETCTHVACASSYAAWSYANNALGAVNPEESAEFINSPEAVEFSARYYPDWVTEDITEEEDTFEG